MSPSDLEIIDSARRAIEKLMCARQLGTQAMPALAPSDFGSLPEALQEAEWRILEENAHGNRVRAGIQMCLSAASAALHVSQRLVADGAGLDPAERSRVMTKCAEDALAASDAARLAAGMLSGGEALSTAPRFEVARI